MWRGYIMLEALIGGALVGAVLIGLFAAIGDARAEAIRQSRTMSAEQLIVRELEELRTHPFANVSTTLVVGGLGTSAIAGGERTVVLGNGRYTINRQVTPGTENVTTSVPLSLPFSDIVVTVSFPDRQGTRSMSARTRLYRE